VVARDRAYDALIGVVGDACAAHHACIRSDYVCVPGHARTCSLPRAVGLVSPAHLQLATLLSLTGAVVLLSHILI
jgi:hypothetical protein